MKKRSLLLSVMAAFGFTTASMAQVPNYVPTIGLVGWYPFNGNANDESTNSNDGTVTGATLTIDRFGNTNSAYSFNGSTDFISVPNVAIQGANDRTISFWINTSAQTTNNFMVVATGSSTYDNGGTFNLRIDNQGRYIGFMGGNFTSSNFDYFPTGTTVLNDGIWHCVIATYTLGTLTLYVDGILEHTANLNLNTIGQSNFIGVSQYPSPSENWFNGIIDDIGIWNRALTQQEITDLYNGCQLTLNTQPSSQTININNNAQFVVSSSDPSATYQWQTDLGVGFQNLNSVGQYSGTITNTLTVSNVTMSNNNQPFRCIVSSGSCSDTSAVAVLTVNNNVGINETSQDKLFAVFPNPAQSVINVKADSKLIGDVYSIYDNTGRVVLTGKLNSQNTTIELGNLSGGIYMFSVGENMKQTFKVIKE